MIKPYPSYSEMRESVPVPTSPMPCGEIHLENGSTITPSPSEAFKSMFEVLDKGNLHIATAARGQGKSMMMQFAQAKLDAVIAVDPTFYANFHDIITKMMLTGEPGYFIRAQIPAPRPIDMFRMSPEDVLRDELRQLKQREQRGDRKAALERRKVEQKLSALAARRRQEKIDARKVEEAKRAQLANDKEWGIF